MQDFLSSNKDVTLAARRGLLLKFKSVARRRLPKAGVTAEERSQQLEAEMQVFATAANAGDLATDFNSSFRSVAPSTLNQTARSVYYQTSASRSMYQEEEGEEIVIDASPPRMAVTRSPPMVNSLPQAVSPPSPSPRYSPLQQPPITPLAASSSQQLAPTISLASHSFLGCSSPPQPDVGNLFDAYNNNEESFVAAPNNNPVGGIEVPRFASTPNPYLASEHNCTAPTEAPRFTSTPNPCLETEPNPDPNPMANSSPTFEELVFLVKNIKSLSRSHQADLVEHIKKLERENPSLVDKLHQQLNLQ